MTDPTAALAELRDWWKSLTDEERWDAFVIEKGNADGLAARPVSGPIHYPECNERCVHYLLGSDDSPTDVSVLGRPSAPEGESGDLGRLRGRGPARPVSGLDEKAAEYATVAGDDALREVLLAALSGFLVGAALMWAVR